MSRITAGALASRHVTTPAGDRTRPTTDRVRESVFALIASRLAAADVPPGEQLAGLRFLDLYAGSGAVGLEAYSRGADVTWVEKDRAVARIVERNIAALKAQGRVVAADVPGSLVSASTPYDIVWLDPPYDVSSEEVDRVLGLLDGRGWVDEGGLVFVERSRRSSAVEFPESFLNAGYRRYGDTVVYYAERRGA